MYCLVSLLFFQIIAKQCFEVFLFWNGYPALYLNLLALIKKKSFWILEKKRTPLYWVCLGEVDIYSVDLWRHSHLGKALCFLCSPAHYSFSVISTPITKKYSVMRENHSQQQCWDGRTLQKQPALACLYCHNGAAQRMVRPHAVTPHSSGGWSPRSGASVVRFSGEASPGSQVREQRLIDGGLSFDEGTNLVTGNPAPMT